MTALTLMLNSRWNWPNGNQTLILPIAISSKVIEINATAETPKNMLTMKII